MCQVVNVECSRNAGNWCHSGSVGAMWVKPGHKQVKTGSSVGQNWITWVTRVMSIGLWVMWVLRVMWATGQVNYVKWLVGLLDFNRQ